MKVLVITVLALAILASCGDGATEVSVPVMPIGPNYVVVEGQQYGYEGEDGAIVLVSYLGERDDEHQFLSQDNDYDASTVIRISPPYDFIKEIDLYENTVTGQRMARLTNDMLASWMLDDAIQGRLKIYKRERDGVFRTFWLDPENKIVVTPLELTEFQ